MPQIVLTDGAIAGLERCRRYLATRDERASVKAADCIRAQFRRLTVSPNIGRPYPLDTGMREIRIPFGSSGYVALYRYDKATEQVFILAFRHEKEADY